MMNLARPQVLLRIQAPSSIDSGALEAPAASIHLVVHFLVTEWHADIFRHDHHPDPTSIPNLFLSIAHIQILSSRTLPPLLALPELIANGFSRFEGEIESSALFVGRASSRRRG